MKRASACIISTLFAAVLFTTFATAQEKKDEKPKDIHAPANLPGVEEAMLTPDYWIALQDNPDEIIMTPEQIEAANERIRTEPIVFQERFGKKDTMENQYRYKMSTGLYMHPVLPLDLPETMPGDSLRTWLSDNIEYLYSREFYDSRNVTWPEYLLKELEDNINLENVPDTITRRYALIVRRADMRLYPTRDFGNSDPKWACDLFQTTSIYAVAPCVVLHTSRDGEYYYVQTPIARGWMQADRIAFGKKKNLKKIVDTDDFLLVTGNKISVYGDKKFERFHMPMWMGGKLPLAKKPGNAWIVKLPYRKPDGSLGVTKGYIRPDADVREGYLPYTKRNMLIQQFKTLHTPYGWAEMLDKRDCSGDQRTMLKCFGLTVGRWPNFTLLASPHRTYINPDWSKERKFEEVSKLEPVITMAGTGGHIVLWLGKAKNGKYYYMHQGGWGYNEGDQHFIVNRVALNEANHSWYSINAPTLYTTFK